MRHLSSEKLVSYIEGNAPEADKLSVETHLNACLQCSKFKRNLERVMGRLADAHTLEPSPKAFQASLDLFQLGNPPEKGILRTIMASLVFDTFDEPLLAEGTRRIGAAPRQLLFRAGEIDVDIKVDSTASHDRLTLEGQVLPSTSKFIENVAVKLQSHGIVRYQTRTNEVGEFSFDEVPRDTYHLLVDLPEGQITLFCVLRANS
jgi:hypothetical protein